jgi:hypothetical protein
MEVAAAARVLAGQHHLVMDILVRFEYYGELQ